MATTTSKQGVSLYNHDITSTIEVSFPLLYIHGRVDYDKVDKVTCLNNENETEWPVKEGEFKIFVLLKEGINHVNLKILDDNIVMVLANYTKMQNQRYVLPVYIVCKNSVGRFMAPVGVSNSVEDAVAKIQLNARLMQTYFAESLYEHGFDRKTFSYAENEENQPLVKIFNSELEVEKTREMSRNDLYDVFKNELEATLGKDSNRKLLVFMSCTMYEAPADETDFTVAKIQSYVTGHAALGGGNMALFGTGSLHTWASNLEELNLKFSDDTKIDRRHMFDDSAGRGTHMANYSTTLGATIHELGHAFDLAHTPDGIMCRGHDDMNYFYTVVKEGPSCDASEKTEITNNQPKYKGAHWYRSSAVILNFNKWFNSSAFEDKESGEVTMALHPKVLGPVGNAGLSRQKDQVSFNSHTWALDSESVLTGIILYHQDYLYGLQFLGVKIKSSLEGSASVDNTENLKLSSEKEVQIEASEVTSEIFGTQPENAIKTVFRFNEPDEQIKTIRVRSGAWIDGIDIETNKKCTEWLGGDGGDLTVFRFNADRSLKAVIGTAGVCVGGIGFVLDNKAASTATSTAAATSENLISFSSSHGIRLVESYRLDNGEVRYFKEYLDACPPLSIFFDRDDLLTDSEEKVDGMIYDDKGGKSRFTLHQHDLKLIDMVTSA